MKFSVGYITHVPNGGGATTTLAKCTGITVRYDGNPIEFYADGYYDPLEIEVGNRSCVITVEFAEWTGNIDPDTVLPNTYIDITLVASAQDASRGLSSLTLSRCKAISWEAASTQDGPVTYRMEFRKTYTS